MPKDLRGGLPTYWTEFGQGAREALLIHCSLAHSGAWKGVAGLLADQLHMRAFDLPGHGRSDDWPGDVDVQELATAMAADLVGSEGPMDIIGHSFGATVALRLAIEHPAMVRSLVLIESVMVAAALADDEVGASQHLADMAGYADAVARGDREAAAREFMKEWGDGTPWEKLPEAQKAFLVNRIHLIEANDETVMKDQPRILARKLIEQVKVPVLLIRGAQSSPIVAPIHAAIYRRLPQAHSLSIEGAGHMVPMSHPEAVAREIAGFLEAVPG
ncbi:alpha/beta hydrolase [Alisedimentitalea sp. MJ-SS2]|uniref:alpha/beta fold hydrolase n=1 Tax=Aliisedimentitalea sp. MJ-SS2 TaxID=3049795 RepID=UPI00290D10AC|nr:alpha/beta hydrolase [Alisedimentitalea sp. MJ-SS2]MDU8927278.1 alpha/beta hydrolase [Alisedimentitalea sp. MJ-SS2]